MAWQYRKYSHAAFWKETSTPRKEKVQHFCIANLDLAPEIGTNSSPAILELEILDWIDLMRESKLIREGEI